jgi:hypothetical protein
MSGMTEVSEVRTKDDNVQVRSENIQMICGINNRTDQELKVQSASLRWGKFEDSPNFPPVNIPAKTNKGAFRSSGRQGSAAGTEGTVVYQIGDDENATITIYWDVPWAPGASNKVTASTSDEDISASVEGFVGSGAVESVTVKVVDGR